ncbi:MAG TPA: hypothetical protein VHP33_05120 [Polyangiaceae bacterium]|nr:hypothetical protein [Polyangiaceae bacterium]
MRSGNALTQQSYDARVLCSVEAFGRGYSDRSMDERPDLLHTIAAQRTEPQQPTWYKIKVNQHGSPLHETTTERLVRCQ